MENRPPLPPFTLETARQKVQAAEDGWNTRDPEKVSLAYTEATVWRNRAEFLRGRAEVRAFLRRKWDRELEYRLKKELWSFHRQPHFGPLRVRVARRFRPMVSVPTGTSNGSSRPTASCNGARRASTICPITEGDRKFR